MALPRRAMLKSLAAVGALWAGLKVRVARAARLRPPGALPPGQFERACIRCFRCAEVCPVQCIRFDGSVSLVDADTPFIDASDRGCVLCMRCTQACPTGALQDLPALAHVVQARVRMGTPVLDTQRCISWNRTGVCRLCVHACPYAGSAVTVAGPALGPVFHPDACVGCGLCEAACPHEARAIRILPPVGDGA